MPEPDPNDNILDNVVEVDFSNPEEVDEMAFPETSEAGVMQVALSALAGGYGASAQRRTDAADQLASDSQRMWSIAMTSPTVMAAHGMRVASEAGAGRTRVEANTPAATQTVGGQV